MRTVNTRLELDKRVLGKKDNRFPVRIIVSYGKDKKRYWTKFRYTVKEWESLHSARKKSDQQKKDLKELDAELTKVRSILQNEALQGDKFSYSAFELLYDRPKKPRKPKKEPVVVEPQPEPETDLYLLFQRYVDDLRNANRIGSAICYHNAMIAFMKFDPKITFRDITPAKLYEFEDWFVSQGNSITTVGIYARSLRTIYNLGVEEKMITRDSYPFGTKQKRKYAIPRGRNMKKALSIDELKMIKNAVIYDKEADFARDIWMFSFYCNGMNMADIFNLKYENIDDEFIRFHRKKTESSVRDVTPIEVYILPEAQQIIDKWGKKPIVQRAYIFGIETKNAAERYRMKCNFIRSINYYMKNLGEKLNLRLKLTTYVARHSYATLQKELGTPLEEISESLGHSSVEVTKNYLDSFSMERKKNTAKKLSTVIR